MKVIGFILSLLFPYKRPSLWQVGLALHIKNAWSRSALDK